MCCYQSHFGNHKPQQNLRLGGAVYQLVGCLLAAGLGIFLGAQWMGVQVEDIAYVALDETDMLEKVPEKLRPEHSACENGVCPSDLTSEEANAKLQSELNGLKDEVAALKEIATSETSAAGVAASLAGRGLAKTDIGREETLAYWARLCEIANDVASLSSGLEPAMTDVTAGHVFDIRSRAFAYGERATKLIPFDRVDPQAYEASQRLIAYYAKGSEFYADATEVWDGLAGAPAPPSAEEDMEKRREQHEKEADLVSSKIAEISSSLSRRYGAEFPTIEL